MTLGKRIAACALALALGLGALEVGDQLGVPGVHSFSGEAFAIVGRPLTPISIAGVGRRTVRRCAVGVYVC
ncbi:MAG: hypothetical protein KDK03_04165 [Rhodobacteraceae bacterium]|nr:hypothetical protein [Paracoccaceae bacterium]